MVGVNWLPGNRNGCQGYVAFSDDSLWWLAWNLLKKLVLNSIKFHVKYLFLNNQETGKNTCPFLRMQKKNFRTLHCMQNEVFMFGVNSFKRSLHGVKGSVVRF